MDLAGRAGPWRGRQSWVGSMPSVSQSQTANRGCTARGELALEQGSMQPGHPVLQKVAEIVSKEAAAAWGC